MHGLQNIKKKKDSCTVAITELGISFYTDKTVTEGLVK